MKEHLQHNEKRSQELAIQSTKVSLALNHLKETENEQAQRIIRLEQVNGIREHHKDEKEKQNTTKFKAVRTTTGDQESTDTESTDTIVRQLCFVF